MKFRITSFLTKILLLNLLIMLIPIVFIGIFSYYKSAELVKEKVNLSSKTILQQTMMQSEQLFKSVDNALTQFSASEFAMQAIDSPYTVNEYSKVKAITSEISKLQSYELRIKNIELVNLFYRWAIMQDGIVNLNDSPLREKYEKEFSADKNKTRTIWSIVRNEETEADHLRIVKTLPLLSTNPQAFIAADISIQELGRLLKAKDELGTLVVLDHDLLPISTGGAPGLKTVLQRLKLQLSQQLTSGGIDGFFYTKDHQYGISYLQSAYNGWIYVSLVSLKDLTAGARVIKNITITICFIVFILTILISIVGSRRMYSPIGKVYKLISESNDAVKGRDEIQHISKHVVDLIQTRSKLTSQLSIQSGQLNKYFIIQLLEGTLSRQEIEEKLKIYGQPLHKAFVALTVQIDNLDNSRFDMKDLDLILFAIENIIAEIIPEQRRHTPVFINRSIVVLLGYTEQLLTIPKTLVDEAHQDAEAIHRAVIQYLDLETSIGISHSFMSLKEAPRAYQEGLEALDYRIRMGSGVILHIGDLRPGDVPMYIFPRDIEQQLMGAIRAADLNRAHELIHELVAEVMMAQGYSYRECQLTLVGVLLEMLKFSQQQELNIGIASSTQDKSVVDRFFELKSAQEIENWFKRDMVEPLIRELEIKRKQQYNTISDSLKQIIHDRYHTDVTLETCSASLNFSPDYLRQVFRKQTGMTFSDYLNSYRIEMAKKLLLETEATITDISEKLNYTNPQNFIRSFRKAVGTTPGKYRSEYKDIE